MPHSGEAVDEIFRAKKPVADPALHAHETLDPHPAGHDGRFQRSRSVIRHQAHVSLEQRAGLCHWR